MLVVPPCGVLQLRANAVLLGPRAGSSATSFTCGSMVLLIFRLPWWLPSVLLKRSCAFGWVFRTLLSMSSD